MAPCRVDWSKLPKELLGLILQLLPDVVDNISFGCVCTTWNSVAFDRSYAPAPQLPWLMLPYKAGQEGKETRKFLNLIENKVYQIKLSKEIQHSRCVGCCFGWLIILDGSCHAHLMNPFSGAIIHLPSTETFPDVLEIDGFKPSGEIDRYSIRRHEPDRVYSISAARLKVVLMSKVILTADPKVDENYVVVAIGFSGLAFCRAGANSWTHLARKRELNTFEDIMYSNGLLYVLHHYGDIVTWDVNDLVPNKALRVAPILQMFSVGVFMPTGNWYVRKRYLAESSGDLLQVALLFREIMGTRLVFGSATCVVCKLDRSSQTWVRVESLHDRVLFMGCNSAVSVSARDYPEFRENSIYFGEYFWEEWWEGDANVAHQNLCVFDLAEGRFVRFFSCASQRIKPPLAWLVPNIR